MLITGYPDLAFSYPCRDLPDGYNYFIDYPNPYYVETGTSGGGSLLRALEAGFRWLRSIDSDKESWDFTRTQYYAKDRRFKLWLGDSGTLLWEMIQDIRQPITFFLDAHRFPPIEDGLPNCRIMEELDQIGMHPIKTHTILIDDMIWSGELAFDYITKEEIVAKILQINPSYQIHFISNSIYAEYVLVAVPPANARSPY